MPDLLNIITFVFTIAGIVGAFLAGRNGKSQKTSELQRQTIETLQIRLETLEKQDESYSRELARLRQIIVTIRHALKRRGLHIEIEGDFVTLIDADGQRSTQVPPVAKVQKQPKPVKLQPIDEEDDDDDTA